MARILHATVHCLQLLRSWGIVLKQCSRSLQSGCVSGDRSTVRFERRVHATKVQLIPITPELCFAFCNKIPRAQLFSMEDGRGSLLRPSFEPPRGSEGRCDTVCGFCVYSTRVYTTKVQHPPQLVGHVNRFPSIGWVTVTLCGNPVLRKAGTGMIAASWRCVLSRQRLRVSIRATSAPPDPQAGVLDGRRLPESTRRFLACCRASVWEYGEWM